MQSEFCLRDKVRLGVLQENGTPEHILDFFAYEQRTVVLVADTQSKWALYEQDKEVQQNQAPLTSYFIRGLPLRKTHSLSFIEVMKNDRTYSLNILDENLDERAAFPLDLSQNPGDVLFIKRVETKATRDIVIGFQENTVVIVSEEAVLALLEKKDPEQYLQAISLKNLRGMIKDCVLDLEGNRLVVLSDTSQLRWYNLSQQKKTKGLFSRISGFWKRRSSIVEGNLKLNSLSSLAEEIILDDIEFGVTTIEAIGKGNILLGVERGRVLLLNLKSGLIERVWKGFRAPQALLFNHQNREYCALLQGKRGVLEVFSPPHSDKLAAFKVDPTSKMTIKPNGSILVIESNLTISELDMPTLPQDVTALFESLFFSSGPALPESKVKSFLKSLINFELEQVISQIPRIMQENTSHLKHRKELLEFIFTIAETFPIDLLRILDVMKDSVEGSKYEEMKGIIRLARSTTSVHQELGFLLYQPFDVEELKLGSLTQISIFEDKKQVQQNEDLNQVSVVYFLKFFLDRELFEGDDNLLIDFIFSAGLKGKLPRLFRQLSVPSESSLHLFFGWLVKDLNLKESNVLKKVKAFGRKLSIFLETSLTSLGNSLQQTILNDYMTRLYKLPFAYEARIILNLLQNAVPDAFQNLQQVVQLDSYLTVAHQFQQASGRQFSVMDLLDKRISLHGICGRELYLSLEGGADSKTIWDGPVARLLREQYPRFFSRDFLLLTAVLYCKEIESFRLDMLVSPLSHLIASLFFWERRALPQTFRHLSVGNAAPIKKDLVSNGFQFLFTLKSFLIEQKQSLSFLLASDQSPAQLLRMAEEPSGIFSSKLYEDSKKLILSLRKEESSMEEQLRGFEDQNFVVAAVDSRDLSLKRLQSRVEASITIFQTLQFIVQEQAKINKRGFLSLLKISEHELSQLLLLHRFTHNENQALLDFVNSIQSNLIVRQLLLGAIQRGYPDLPLMLCERLAINKNPLLAEAAISLCEESKMDKSIEVLKMISFHTKEKSEVTLKMLKYLLALDLHSLKQNLPLEELSTLVPERIWRLKVTRDRQTLSMKTKRSVYIGILVDIFEDLKSKDLLSQEEASFLGDTRIFLQGRNQLHID